MFPVTARRAFESRSPSQNVAGELVIGRRSLRSSLLRNNPLDGEEKSSKRGSLDGQGDDFGREGSD